jgi:NAD-dependent deacetylase
MKKLVFLTGAGISEESGMAVFRGTNGLWEDYDPMEVCSVSGWNKNPKLCQKFYNERRVTLGEIEPNEAHFICEKLSDDFDVKIITTNVDDLHERAGSKDVLHLHGELTKVCDLDKKNVEDIGYGLLSEVEITKRPFVVFFGEDVPLMDKSIEIVESADILVVVGTSLSVYPAASLISYFKGDKIVYIDPKADDNVSSFLSQSWMDLEDLKRLYEVEIIGDKATTGLKKMIEGLDL